MMFETAVIEVAGNVVEHRRPPGHVTWAFRLSVLGDRLEARLSDSGEEYPGGTWGISMPADLLQEKRPRAAARDRRPRLPGVRAVRARQPLDHAPPPGLSLTRATTSPDPGSS
jgi:hypothetical protein